MVASPEAVEFVRQHGGLLFVWADHAQCCTGTLTYLEASVDSPGPQHDFLRLSGEGSGFQLMFDPHGHRMPDEVHLDVKGWRRKRVRAYWNGCTYAIDADHAAGDGSSTESSGR